MSIQKCIDTVRFVYDDLEHSSLVMEALDYLEQLIKAEERDEYTEDFQGMKAESDRYREENEELREQINRWRDEFVNACRMDDDGGYHLVWTERQLKVAQKEAESFCEKLGIADKYAREFEMSDVKPRRAKVKLTRTVTEIAVVLLDRDGNIEEVEEVHEEIEFDDAEVHDIRTVLSVHP